MIQRKIVGPINYQLPCAPNLVCFSTTFETLSIEFFLNRTERSLNSVNIVNLRNCWSPHYYQFKIVSVTCVLVAATQEVANLNNISLATDFCH